MKQEEIFELAAKDVLKMPKGERTLSEMHITLSNKYGNDSKYRKSLHDFFLNMDNSRILLEYMIKSGYDFDIYLRKIEGKVDWEIPDFIALKETFASYVDDNKFLLEKILNSKDKEFVVSLMPGIGERGQRFMTINTSTAEGYSVKCYQGGNVEKRVMLAFSDGIGPKIYDAGEHSFVEELMFKLNLPNAPKFKYLLLEEVSPPIAGHVTALIFKTLHTYNILYDAWNWTDEIRIKVDENNHGVPKILDFGSAYIWPEKDFNDRHQADFEEIKKTDMEFIINGFNLLYGPYSKSAIEAFEEVYHSCVIKIEKNIMEKIW